jgi:hypothetical protein
VQGPFRYGGGDLDLVGGDGCEDSRHGHQAEAVIPGMVLNRVYLDWQDPLPGNEHGDVEYPAGAQRLGTGVSSVTNTH